MAKNTEATTSGVPEDYGSDLGMQGFTMVTPDQLPEPTGAASEGTFIDMLMNLLASGYGLALGVTGIWFALSFVMGMPAWKALVAFILLLLVGSYF